MPVLLEDRDSFGLLLLAAIELFRLLSENLAILAIFPTAFMVRVSVGPSYTPLNEFASHISADKITACTIGLKDVSLDLDRMHTTAGSLALQDSIVPRDAQVVKLLRDAGAIILGHTDMCEWALPTIHRLLLWILSSRQSDPQSI